MALASTTTLALSLLFLLPFLSSATVEEEFHEELLLKPLPDRKVLAHFHFQTEAPVAEDSFARHHHLFPKSISQLVCVFTLLFPLFYFIWLILGLVMLLVPIIITNFVFNYVLFWD